MENGTKQLSSKTAHMLKTQEKNIIFPPFPCDNMQGTFTFFLPLLYYGESKSTENLPVDALQLILCETQHLSQQLHTASLSRTVSVKVQLLLCLFTDLLQIWQHHFRTALL